MTALALGGLLAWASPADDLTAYSEGLAVPEPVPEVADGYRFAGSIFADLAERAARRPGVLQVEAIGRSGWGAPIWAFHVQRPGTEPTRDVLVFAGIHALEWISTEVAVDLLVELVEHPPPGVRVTVIPLLNPDGRTKVERDLLAGENVYRRGNADNVDLNRDFAVNTDVRAVWSAVIPGYYAHSEVPLSQPESRALDALAERERYDRTASLHAFGGYLYFPWAGRFARPDAWADHLALGRAMERAQGAHAYRPRQLARWGFFFRAQGSEVDHLHGRYGATSFLVELTRSGFDWRRPRESLRTYFRWYNPTNSERHRRKGVAAMRALIRDPGESW